MNPDPVEQPAGVARITAVVRQLLQEVRSVPLNEAGGARLAEVRRRSIAELEQGLAPELIDELERIMLPLHDNVPSDAQLRITRAQLVGWLGRVLHGIQTALFAQQMAAQQQLQSAADVGAAIARVRAAHSAADDGPALRTVQSRPTWR